MFRAPILAGLALGTALAPASAQAQSVDDRYGPAPTPLTAVGRPRFSTPVTMRARMLEWPGKTTAVSVQQPAEAYAPIQTLTPPSAYGVPRYAGVAHAAYRPPPRLSIPPRPVPAYDQAAARARIQAPPSGQDQDGWRPVYAAYAPAHAAVLSQGSQSSQPSLSDAQLSGAPRQSALPTSVYTPAPLADTTATPLSPRSRALALPPPRGYAPRTTTASGADDERVRFYSVHRAFGLQPDPAPIPPQFFTATADLSDPPGPLPTERTASGGASKTGVSVHATPDTSAN